MSQHKRYMWVDVLKASGIVTVLWIHAYCQLGQEKSVLIERLAMLSRFAVPAFFFASGFLQAAGPRMRAPDFIAHRARRLLVPYLIASAGALCFRYAVLGDRFSAMDMCRALLLGDAWGIYYFVPVLVAASAVGEVLFRYPRLAWPTWIAWAVLGVMAYRLELYAGSFSLELRNPCRWWGWFLGGWVVAVHIRHISALRRSLRIAAGCGALLASAACYARYCVSLPSGWSPEGATVEYIMVQGILVSVVLLAWQGPQVTVVRWLSDATYPIYLLHYFVVALLLQRLGWSDAPLRVFVVTGAATLAMIAVARQIGDLLHRSRAEAHQP